MYFIESSKPIYLGLISERFTPQKIKNISLHDLYVLRESYGKIEFGNKEYENIIKQVSDEIIKDLKTGLDYDIKLDSELYFKHIINYSINQK